MKGNQYLYGLACGLVGSIWHVFWSALVWLGWAQAFINFIFRLPFITPPYKIIPFDLGTAVMPVTVVFVIWAILGFMAAIVWDTVRQQ